MRLIPTCSTTFRRTAWLVAACCLAAATVNGAARPARAEFFRFTTALTYTTQSFTNTPNPVVINITPLDTNPSDENADGSGIGTDIVYANISVTGLNHNFLGASNLSIPYSFDVTITDYPDFGPLGTATGSAVFTVSGLLTGSVGPGNKVNLDTTPTITSTNPQDIGDETYTLSLRPFVPPGQSFAGAFGLHVDAEPTPNIPEPITLQLMAVGLFALATPVWRRLRLKRPR